MQLLPVLPKLEDNPRFLYQLECAETLQMCVDYYKVIGYNPPWICYYAEKDGVLVGNAGFKGAPVGNRIEIAYGTFPAHQQRGIGTLICRALVELALATDPQVQVTARTLPEENFSTKILRKNGFVLIGEVLDPEDGTVWEWEYRPNNITQD